MFCAYYFYLKFWECLNYNYFYIYFYYLQVRKIIFTIIYIIYIILKLYNYKRISFSLFTFLITIGIKWLSWYFIDFLNKLNLSKLYSTFYNQLFTFNFLYSTIFLSKALIYINFKYCHIFIKPEEDIFVEIS